MEYRNNGIVPIAVHELQYIIQAEYRSMVYAQRLVQLAPPEHRRHFVRMVEVKQKERLANWARQYHHLTACYPVFSKVEPPWDYVSGLKASILDSLDAADLYAGLLQGTQDPALRQILQNALNGENRWAARQQFLYSSYLLENGNTAQGKGLIGVIKKQLPPI